MYSLHFLYNNTRVTFSSALSGHPSSSWWSNHHCYIILVKVQNLSNILYMIIYRSFAKDLMWILRPDFLRLLGLGHVLLAKHSETMKCHVMFGRLSQTRPKPCSAVSMWEMITVQKPKAINRWLQYVRVSVWIIYNIETI